MKTFDSVEKMMKSAILKNLIGEELVIDHVKCYVDEDGIWLYPSTEFEEHLAENMCKSMWGRILDMKIDRQPLWKRKIEPDGIDYEMPFDPFN